MGVNHLVQWAILHNYFVILPVEAVTVIELTDRRGAPSEGGGGLNQYMLRTSRCNRTF